jgi:hypothetical protein
MCEVEYTWIVFLILDCAKKKFKSWYSMEFTQTESCSTVVYAHVQINTTQCKRSLHNSEALKALEPLSCTSVTKFYDREN